MNNVVPVVGVVVFVVVDDFVFVVDGVAVVVGESSGHNRRPIAPL